MPGFLDPSAPNALAEYTRYLDGDILGKLIAKNVLVNALGYDSGNVVIPTGRYGNSSTRYDDDRKLVLDKGDGHIITPDHGQIDFEIKCARINIANRFRDTRAENWAFTGLLQSPKGVRKSYDVLIAIGISLLGLEHDDYWPHLSMRQAQLAGLGYSIRIDALPHEAEFLPVCSFFFVPRIALKQNFFRVNLKSLAQSSFAKYHAVGHDQAQCRARWSEALSASAAEA